MPKDLKQPSDPALASVSGYAAFMERGNGWEQVSIPLRRPESWQYVRTRRKMEKLYPMGKRFKTMRHNDSALTEGGPVSADCNRKPNPPFGAANG